MYRRLTASVFSALLFSGFAAERASALSPEESTRASAVAVASIVGTHRGNGAGVVLSVSGTTVRILTAKHVATFGTTITAAIDGAEPAPATLVYADPSRDLALIDAHVSADVAAAARPARVGAVGALHENLHLWGESHGILAVEHGDLALTGSTLPDGPAQGRFAFACSVCHQGDSGAGVFDADGTLVGIYLGFYREDDGSQGLSVAMAPTPVLPLAMLPQAGRKLAFAANPPPSLAATSAVPAVDAALGNQAER
jgi:hypothetical protein